MGVCLCWGGDCVGMFVCLYLPMNVFVEQICLCVGVCVRGYLCGDVCVGCMSVLCESVLGRASVWECPSQFVFVLEFTCVVMYVWGCVCVRSCFYGQLIVCRCLCVSYVQTLPSQDVVSQGQPTNVTRLTQTTGQCGSGFPCSLLATLPSTEQGLLGIQESPTAWHLTSSSGLP